MPSPSAAARLVRLAGAAASLLLVVAAAYPPRHDDDGGGAGSTAAVPGGSRALQQQSSDPPPRLRFRGDDPRFRLGLCEGDCDADVQCRDSLVCFKRSGFEAVPGCDGRGVRGKDYCVPDDGGVVLRNVGRNPGPVLGRCQGDCDVDGDCRGSLVCFQRRRREAVPGCDGAGIWAWDYCVDTDPAATDRPTPRPAPTPPAPTPPAPTVPNPPPRPTRRPTPSGPSSRCFTSETYDRIDRDVAAIRDGIRDPAERSHFLGGVVRLAAHDFMDYDPNSAAPMGADGCFDPGHRNNAGLDTIWCDDCPLTLLHRRRYQSISRADFWIAAANAVVRRQSTGDGPDLRAAFRWGRRDRDDCRGSGARLPRPAGCREHERVFVDRMGLGWRDVAALMGAHTLGRGSADFSGHDGTWVDDQDTQVFDNQYYVDMFENAWRLRNRGGPNNGGPPQDWTTGRGAMNRQMMLNTDMCLAFDIDDAIRRGPACCTRLDKTFPDGRNECVDQDSARRRCPAIGRNAPRGAARDAMEEFRDGDNALFYAAFAEAWLKATTAGQRGLRRLGEGCEPE